jgi:hypothetical protein
MFLFSFFFYKIREQEDRRGPGVGVLLVGVEEVRKGMRG